MITITPLYAAPLAILLVGLVLRVVALRRRLKVGIGDGGERELAKAVRAHGNAAETIPIAIVLLLLAELAGVGSALLHGAGIALLVGRLLHAYGLSTRSGMSFGRFTGMVLTLLAIAVLAVVSVVRVL
ncbi:MAG: MAPEG family protein [Gammaproteobacteria bacterium]